LNFKIILLSASLAGSITLQAQEKTVQDNDDRPSRLEEGYGSNELLSDNLPYLPTISLEERIKFMGDVRLRSQTIKKNGDKDHTSRYRVRLGFEAALVEDVKFEFMIATGEGDPVSTNQDFGQSYTKDNIILDVADIYYTYGYHSFLRAGKMKLPFYRTHKNQMIWDNDFRPVGLFTKYKLLENTDITAGTFLIRHENLTDVRNSPDTDQDYTKPIKDGKAVYLYSLQAIHYVNDFRFGISAYVYDGLKGQSPYVKYKTGDNSKFDGKNLSKGNSLDYYGNYLNDYHLLEAFSQYQITGNLAFGVDFVYNTAVSTDNFAYNLSAMYGKLKKNGDFKLGYYYRDTQKDAVFAAYSDSDFAGGYAGSKGHQFMAGYQLFKSVQLAATYIDAEVDKEDGQEDYTRLHLDLKFKF
jgi:hypothetical protein